MLIKNIQPFRRIKLQFIFPLILFFITTAKLQAQTGSAPPAAAPGESVAWLFIGLAVLAIVSAGAAYWWFGVKKAQLEAQSKPAVGAADRDALDGNKELEWLRKNQQLVNRKNNASAASKNNYAKQSFKNAASANQVSEQNSSRQDQAHSGEAKREMSGAKGNEVASPLLPIFSVNRLELARPFDALPISNDEDLVSAIEQGYDEFEEDEAVRDLAVRVLTAFKTRNSVETLSQIALYDLSSSLRSKAVNVLSEFDHESVFETILLANADPTREVRAAAARGLTKLTFNRADAWSRISETGEEGRIAQAARAAIESGFVEMSFARLVSKDYMQAYEAFALMALLIKAGESAKIFNAFETSRDLNVQRAILHTIKTVRDPKVLDELYLLLEKDDVSAALQADIDQTIEEISPVAA